jgi:hypothetical protein
MCRYCYMLGQDSSVDIANRYGPDVPRIEVGSGEIFRTSPELLWSPLSLLYNGYLVSFPEEKWPGRGGYHLSASIAEVREIVDLYLYCPSGHSWPALGSTLSLLFMETGVTRLTKNRNWYRYITYISCVWQCLMHSLFPSTQHKHNKHINKIKSPVFPEAPLYIGIGRWVEI